MKPSTLLEKKLKDTPETDYVISPINDWLTEFSYPDYIELSGIIEDDLTLESEFYKVTEDDLTVQNGCTLKILPGTVIEFDEGRKFVVNGNLDISKVDISPVFFRGRGGAIWEGLEVYSEFWEVPAFAILKHVKIQNAKAALNLGPRATMLIEENSTIRNNQAVSNYILGQMTIRDSEILQNNRGWTVHSIGQNPSDQDRVGHLELSNNIIRNTQHPLETKGFGRVTLRNNPYFEIFTPLQIENETFLDEGNTFIKREEKLKSAVIND